MSRRRSAGAFGAVVAATVLAVLAAGCSGGAQPRVVPATVTPPAPPTSATQTTPATPAASATPGGSASADTSGEPDPAYSDWELGVHLLPVDANGFGEIRPTPKALRMRRYPTTDLLPPPADDAFHSTVGPVTDAIRQRMGETWSPRCPVALGDLRYLTVSFRGFDGRAHTGELVVAAQEAQGVVSVFATLFDAGYPIEEMRLPTTADLDAPPTGDGNNTAGLVCRATTGGTSWSAHAYGLAIDLNPFLNPYLKGDLVVPERASAYLDRTRTQPGIIHAGDVVVRAFAAIGWEWGGAWSSLKDYQHFSATGR